MDSDSGLEVDYSERAGFLMGKSAAMADWYHKREAKQYAALFARLYFARAARQFYARNREAICAKRRAAYEPRPKSIHHCKVCGGECSGSKSVYCSHECHLTARRARECRGINQRGVRERVLEVLRSLPGSTPTEISEAAGPNYGTTQNLLTRLSRAGLVRRSDGRYTAVVQP